jgi:hypothetical protein
MKRSWNYWHRYHKRPPEPNAQGKSPAFLVDFSRRMLKKSADVSARPERSILE